jgi:hypothetical protein
MALERALHAERSADLEQPIAPFARVGFVESVTILVSVNVLFLVFDVIQFGYLFGGRANVDVAGFTYAEYARRGFFELVTVAVISLPLILVLHWVARLSTPGAQRVFVALAGGFLALLIVIMISSLGRMGLYTSLYGLTELRLYTTAFMGWLAFVFLWFAATVLRGQRRRFAIGALASGLVVVWSLNVINPDALIARTNLGRTDAAQPVDGRYLGSLSADAVPVLVAGSSTLPEAERARLIAMLADRWPSSPADWRTWNWSRAQAATAVASATSQTQPAMSRAAAARSSVAISICTQEEATRCE